MATDAGSTGMSVPNTVEEVLMARIDRLSEGAKLVLQIGAVMGREFGGGLLREVTGLPEQGSWPIPPPSLRPSYSMSAACRHRRPISLNTP